MGLADRLAGLPSMFERSVKGRTLILDCDFPAYQAAATVKKLSTALTRFQTLVETERFVTSADTVEVHLTPRGCSKCLRYDYPTVKPYQGNREGKVKPPLLEPLRSAVAQHEWPDHWSVFSWYDREADDGMMMSSMRHGDSGVVLSGDKDLCITPNPYWITDEGRLDIIEDRFGWIKGKELTSSFKVVGHGTKFFWAQMLMGDPADNVKGINRWYGSLAGPVKAMEVLGGITNEDEAANLVLRGYADIGQDFLAEAQCLWLRRSNEDCAYQYLSELDLDADLRQWLNSLHQYHQEFLAYKAALRMEEHGEDEPGTSPRTEAAGVAGSKCLPWEDCTYGTC